LLISKFSILAGLARLVHISILEIWGCVTPDGIFAAFDHGSTETFEIGSHELSIPGFTD
jgi:hypothetical protein